MVMPPVHAYVSGAVPPVVVSVSLPFAFPQVELVDVADAVGPGVSLIIVDATAEQPLLSVTVRV